MRQPVTPWFIGRLLGACALLALLSPAAQAYSFRQSYIPPEIAYADDLRQKVTLPGKIDVNQANFNQLKLLPGFDEELALKLMRIRPIENIQDFYRMPGLEHKQVERLIQMIQPKILLK